MMATIRKTLICLLLAAIPAAAQCVVTYNGGFPNCATAVDSGGEEFSLIVLYYYIMADPTFAELEYLVMLGLL